MATHKFTNAAIWASQYDLSADHNSVTLEQGVEKLDKTTFGQTTRSNQGGLFTVGAKGQGLLSYGVGEVEANLQTVFAVADVPLTVGPLGAAAAERAYFTKVLTGDLKPLGGQVGDLHGFEWSAAGNAVPWVPGTVMAAKAARTTSGNSGTALALGAVSASQRIYAALHVFAASGTSPTLAVTIKSDDLVGFGSPATQITLSTATTVGAQFASAAGAITDTFWRVDWTIGGTTPSFTFAVVIGII